MSSAAAQARRRLVRDFRSIQDAMKEAGGDPGFAASPEQDNIFEWNAVIFGGADTHWQDGMFKLKLTFTEEYPNKPPQVKFITNVFHPNVYKNGNICLDILQDKWASGSNVESILVSIQSLLNDPNPDSPANAEAARLCRENKPEYYRRVRQCVEASWDQAV